MLRQRKAQTTSLLLQLLLQAGSESRSVGLDLSRQPPSAGQAPLAVLRGSLGLAYVHLSCVTDVGLFCVVERYDLTELKEYYYIITDRGAISSSTS